MHSLMLTALTAVLVASPSVSLAQQVPPFYLHTGDRVVFYGDSITEQRMYTTIAETFVVTRYPTLKVSFTNSGWGGDRVSGGGGGDISTRLERDVIPYKPTVVTIMLGMNDGGYKSSTVASDEAFFKGFEHIVQTLQTQDPGVRITAIESTPYDNVTRPPAPPVADNLLYNQVLLGYGKWIENYGSEHHLRVADANTPFVHVLEKAQGLNPAVAKEILPDHIHPSFGGHMVLAEALLKSWDARPVVASVEIAAAGKTPRVQLAEHARVSSLAAKEGLSWTELDDALPLPFTQWQGMWGGGPTILLVMQSSDITTALNEEPLVVTGLHDGVYALMIDGAEIGTYTNDQFAKGINLATLKTPMSDQAMTVYQMVNEHSDLHYDRWRHVQVPLAGNKLSQTEAAVSAMDALEDKVVDQERKAALPREHTFSITPVR